ncbi:TPA: CsbD family protein [Streptococcus pneumoniae]
MSLENKLEQATDAVKEGFGKVTGDSKTELEGAVEKTVAKAKDVVEDAKGAVEGLKNVFTK